MPSEISKFGVRVRSGKTGSGDLVPAEDSGDDRPVRSSGDGQRGKASRLVTPSRRAPVRAPIQLTEPLPPDERSERSRYHIYRLRAGELVSIAQTGTKAHAGVMLITLDEDGEFDQTDDSVGLLDAGARGYDKPGKWIVNPWTLGRKPSEISKEQP